MFRDRLYASVSQEIISLVCVSLLKAKEIISLVCVSLLKAAYVGHFCGVFTLFSDQD